MSRNTIPAGVTYTIVVGYDPPLADNPAQEADLVLAITPIFRTWLVPLGFRRVHNSPSRRPA